jgi:plastocyanin
MKRIFFQGVIIACTILLFLSCSKNSSPYGNNPPPSGGNSNKISIANMSFVASAITVTKGTTVTWTNNDYTTHTVTANDNSFNSNDLDYGNTYSHTFDSTGTFSYHCSIHPDMTGSVVVK